MNVAFASNVVYPFVTGGAEKRIYEIGSRLVDRGHSVTVYARHFWEGPPEITYDGMQLRAVAGRRELYTDGRRSIGEAIEFGVKLYRPLSRQIDDHDVVVASVFPYFPVLSAGGAAWRHDVPLVTTWHECWREYWWEYLGRLGFGGILTERAVARVPQHPIAVSGVTADRMTGLGIDREAITVVPNGVDVEHIQSVVAASDAPDIVFVGRLIEAKRVERLLESIASLDGRPTIGIVGEGPMRESLERRAATLGLGDSVRFYGLIDDRDEMLSLLRGADVFASASEREGFGIAFVEAMAAGCTVVAADHENSAAREVVSDAGFLPDPTVSSLATAIEHALAGERPTVDPSQRALEYDWDAVTDRALTTYRAAIQ